MAIRTASRPGRRRAPKPPVRDDADAELVPEGDLKLPHERDQTPNAKNTSNRVTRQAHRDLSSGRQDTDVRSSAMDSFRRATATRARTGTRVSGTRPARKSPVS